MTDSLNISRFDDPNWYLPDDEDDNDGYGFWERVDAAYDEERERRYEK